ncbi:MAG: ferritin-like domain-containing protein [Mycobacteriales bacterium]
MTDPTREDAVLTDLLVAEHAAVYAYGVLGARLDEVTRRTALAAFDAHRATRDDLLGRLRARELATPGPAASYQVAVGGRAQALALATRVEVELGVRWHDLVGATDDGALRRLAVQGLQDCTVRATRWRQLAGTRPLTEALPGQA